MYRVIGDRIVKEFKTITSSGEFEVLLSFNSPHLLHGTIGDDNRVILDRVDGTLSLLIKGKSPLGGSLIQRISSEKAAQLISGLAEGLRMLHKAGFSHGNLIADNIVYTADRLIIAEFDSVYLSSKQDADWDALVRLYRLIDPSVQDPETKISKLKGTSPSTLPNEETIATGMYSRYTALRPPRFGVERARKSCQRLARLYFRPETGGDIEQEFDIVRTLKGNLRGESKDEAKSINLEVLPRLTPLPYEKNIYEQTIVKLTKLLYLPAAVFFATLDLFFDYIRRNTVSLLTPEEVKLLPDALILSAARTSNLAVASIPELEKEHSASDKAIINKLRPSIASVSTNPYFQAAATMDELRVFYTQYLLTKSENGSYTIFGLYNVLNPSQIMTAIRSQYAITAQSKVGNIYDMFSKPAPPRLF